MESGRVGLINGRLVSRIRHYKVGRAMNNMTFDYTLTPLEMAESMAFNLDCLGCICWFEYGNIVSMPGSTEPMSPALERYIRFFHARRDLLRDARVVADVAVLRSFPSLVYGEPKVAGLTARVEDLLIENRRCFQIIHDHQLGDLSRYRALVLAGCAALSDRHVDADPPLRGRRRPAVRHRPAGHARPVDAAAGQAGLGRPAGRGRGSH